LGSKSRRGSGYDRPAAEVLPNDTTHLREDVVEGGRIIMKISLDEYSRVLQLSRTGRVGAAVLPAPPPVDAQEEIPPAASVELSPRAQQIRQIKFILDEIPEVREEMVQELRRKIEAGEYNVSSAEIADLIVRRTIADNVR